MHGSPSRRRYFLLNCTSLRQGMVLPFLKPESRLSAETFQRSAPWWADSPPGGAGGAGGGAGGAHGGQPLGWVSFFWSGHLWQWLQYATSKDAQIFVIRGPSVYRMQPNLQHRKQRRQSLAERQRRRKEKQCLYPLTCCSRRAAPTPCPPARSSGTARPGSIGPGRTPGRSAGCTRSAARWPGPVGCRPESAPSRTARPSGLAVGETVILLTPPIHRYWNAS